MKKTAVVLFILQLFFSCNGLNNKTGSFQKSESGLNGRIKKVTNYMCPVVRSGNIPKDTMDYTIRITTSYDSFGNRLEENSFNKVNNQITESLIIYSGEGKNRFYKLKFISGFDDTKEKKYKYIWSDDYHFMMVPMEKSDKSSFIVESTLNKDFRITKSIYKKGDTIRITDEFEYVVKEDKLHEKTLKRMINEGSNNRIIYLVNVVKEYDHYGNPVLTYNYVDPNKQKLDGVIFSKYEYYNDEKTHSKK